MVPQVPRYRSFWPSAQTTMSAVCLASGSVGTRGYCTGLRGGRGSGPESRVAMGPDGRGGHMSFGGDNHHRQNCPILVKVEHNQTILTKIWQNHPFLDAVAKLSNFEYCAKIAFFCLGCVI